MKIPDEVQAFLSKNSDLELALIGCRADSSHISYDCCEYDIAVLGSNENGYDKKIIQLGDNTIEFLHFPNYQNYGHSDISLFNMIKIEKSSDLFISPHPPEIDRKSWYIAAGKRRVVDSLFNVSKNSSNRAKLDSSLNLKIAAYDLIEGILLISQTKPMPIHELNQLRQVEVRKDFINEAIQVCIECLGIERATRTIINRSFKALKEILKERYDVELLSSKIDFLVKQGLLADCYYYIGKLVCSHLKIKDNAPQLNYHKLNTIALDLTSDYEKVKNMSALIKRDCKLILKN
ncbi:MAG: hypothetical protein QOK62_05350 [Nitrososphaeraceae archaeon]|nr:hypothetical protein [Nitrososphaeraceae archaeon]